MKRWLCVCLLVSLSAGCQGRDSVYVKSLLAGEQTHSFVEPATSERPDLTLEQAYKEQAGYVRAQRRAGREVVGYKVAYTSTASQLRARIDAPIYGRLFEGMSVPNGGSVVSGGFRRFVVEAEVAVTIGRTIDEPIETVDELLPYIATLHPALEMPDALFGFDVAPNAVDMVAANTAAYRYALGAGIEPVGFDPADLEVALFTDRTRYSTGPASDCLGGPLQVVLWLVQALQAEGETLEAGQVVLTGTPARTIIQPTPDSDIAREYAADCGVLGRVTVVVR
jgi:2-keto-4-pentenoate hydratase